LSILREMLPVRWSNSSFPLLVSFTHLDFALQHLFIWRDQSFIDSNPAIDQGNCTLQNVKTKLRRYL
jgi:hypothetical protein